MHPSIAKASSLTRSLSSPPGTRGESKRRERERESIYCTALLYESVELTFDSLCIVRVYSKTTDGASCSPPEEKEGRQAQEEVQALPVQQIHARRCK